MPRCHLPRASIKNKMPSVCGCLAQGWTMVQVPEGCPSQPRVWLGATEPGRGDTLGKGVKEPGDPQRLSWAGSLCWLPALARGRQGAGQHTLPFNYPLGLIGFPASFPTVRKRPLFAACMFTKQMDFKSFHRHREPI